MQPEERNDISIGAFDFTPDWAKKDAGVSVGRAMRPAEEASSRQKQSTFSQRGRAQLRQKRMDKDRPAPRQQAGFRREPALEADIKVLPDNKAFGTVVKKLQHTGLAYKLKDIAYFFLDNPPSVLLKIVPKGGEKFHQCKICSFASASQDDVAEHILSEHLGDYYESSIVETDPPKGDYPCVARCGLSGVLIGPPNFHDFNSNIREMIRTRYPSMSESEYRSRIEMVRDKEAVEEWRKSASKKTLYRQKDAGDGEYTLTRAEAEGRFRMNFMPSLVAEPKHLMITADKALTSPCRPLAAAAAKALEEECRTPRGMCFALHGAFHYRKMNFFRVNDARGQEFVTAVQYKVFDTEHAIEELAETARFITEHPCSFKSEIAGDASGEKNLSWLVSTGHVVAFANGAYSAVEKFPKYGPQWRGKKTETPPAAGASESVAEQSCGEEKAVDAETPAAVEQTDKVQEVDSESSSQLA